VPVTPQATGRNAIAETRVLSISSNSSARAATESRRGTLTQRAHPASRGRENGGGGVLSILPSREIR
jgi:hypothetical protein